MGSQRLKQRPDVVPNCRLREVELASYLPRALSLRKKLQDLKLPRRQGGDILPARRGPLFGLHGEVGDAHPPPPHTGRDPHVEARDGTPFLGEVHHRAAVRAQEPAPLALPHHGLVAWFSQATSESTPLKASIFWSQW